MKIAIGCFIGLILSVSIGAESLFEGQVRLESGEPIADAQVRLFDLTDLRRGAIAHAMTDGTGYFSLPLMAMTGRTLPQRFALGPNYPNPFNPSTIIPYQLAASSAVRLEVFNLLGQRIATLVDGEQSAGSHAATWHATDSAGRAVGAGVYIYRMTVDAESQTGRMVLIDGQAGVSAAGAASVWSGVSGGGEDAQVYGLIVSGRGLVPYVDSSFRVESGMAPVELVVSPGQYLAGKAVDFGDLFDLFNDQQEEETQEEAAETDSTSSEEGPDLIVQSPSVNDSILTPGQAFTLHVAVHNQGDEQAAATMLHYYRSNNAKITASDTEVGTDEIGTLAALDSSAVSIALTAPTGGGPGVYFYGACVASVRGESNTDNNCSAAVRITVGGQVATEDSTKTDPADSTATTQTDDIGGSEEPAQADSTSVEALDDSQGFNIELVFADNIPSEDRDIFRRAAQEWERVILDDLPDVVLERTFHETSPTIEKGRKVDDLLVVVYQKEPSTSLAPVFGIGAFAQMFLARPRGLPVLGQVTYEEDSRRYLTEIHEERSEFYAKGNRINGYPPYAPVDELVEQEMHTLALHEIGHVLGVGTSDQWFDYIKPAEYWDNPLPYNIIGNPFPIQFFYPSDTYAWEGFLRLRRVFEADLGSDSGAFLYYGEAIPVHDDRHHWGRIYEANLDVMSLAAGVLAPNGTALPPYISPLTRGALADLGYEVEMSTPIYDVALDRLRTLPESAAGKPTLSRPTFICKVVH